MRKMFIAGILGSAALLGPSIKSAQACPMCAEANKVDENRPKAYMYSILFMMSMPAIVLTGFGIGLYRLHRKHQNIEPNDSFDC